MWIVFGLLACLSLGGAISAALEGDVRVATGCFFGFVATAIMGAAWA